MPLCGRYELMEPWDYDYLSCNDYVVRGDKTSGKKKNFKDNYLIFDGPQGRAATAPSAGWHGRWDALEGGRQSCLSEP